MRIAPFLFALAVAGCATAPHTPIATPALPPGQIAWYKDAASAGKRVWRIDSKASLIAVTVRRGGALARLGHDHVVASHSVEGLVAPDDGRADFQFRLDQLRVDESDLRKEAGLATTPSDEAIEGTRTNMLTRVLDAERFPVVVMRAVPVAGKLGGTITLLRLHIVLHGVERTVDVPTTMVVTPDGLVASGSLTLLQTDFGITPMSVLGGAISVQDRMELRFRLVAGQP